MPTALTTSIANGEESKQELEEETKKHVISKRESVLLFDNFPYEPIYKPRPQKVIYRRVSSPKHSPKPKYGPPRSKYRGSKPRRPIKKYKKPAPKYGPPSRRPSKPRYGPPKKSHKPFYGPPKKKHHAFYSPEPVGFGEPPSEYFYNNPKQSFGEPPIDFSSQPKPFYEPYQAASDFNPTVFDEEASKFGPDFKHWNIDQNDNLDTSYAYTQQHPIYTEQELSFDPSSPDEDFNAYLERYKFRDLEEDGSNVYDRKRKPYYIDSFIANGVRKPDKSREEEEVLVGGQYAEPPARIVHKSFNMNDSPYSDDFSPALGYVDPDVAASATMSSYVNYKNSNLAFSPQNLNDAFSIVDKK